MVYKAAVFGADVNQLLLTNIFEFKDRLVCR